MTRLLKRYALVALSFVGSAILLFSCENALEEDTSDGDEKMMTEYSENLTLVMSQNGRKSYRFATPLLEGYSLAKEPYREFRKGVKVITYLDDSMSTVDAVLTSNYAIYYEKRELWEAKGDVVVEKSDGKTLYTQQLFWNARTKRIYSNVDSKIVQGGGDDVFVGEGFESDEAFKDWRFRRMTGRMRVEVTPTADSTAMDSIPAPAVSPRRDAEPRASSRTEPQPAPQSTVTTPKPQPTPIKPPTPSTMLPQRGNQPQTVERKSVKVERLEELEEVNNTPKP